MKTFGLIGKKLSHSFSKKYFSEKFKKENIKSKYNNFELENISDFKELIKKQDNLKGLNVTIPYKQEIIPYLDKVSKTATKIGAVNTILIKNGKLKGYNTDAYGFKQMIKPFLKKHHTRALIFGTGGASKAISYVFNKIGIDCLFISRHPIENNELSYSEINEYLIKFNPIIVNTTPLGMYPNIDEALPLPYTYITKNHLCIDLIYNPEETVFLKEAKKQGSITLNGLSMLKHQAEKSWEIWNK